ncbi:hypothetical protein BUALT_Bualt01G0022300 [Buddleja alternifolia]|uniref:Uncharacterized protein n=1 Tax=Buddleja alternifolia TaxID=168488 RepID=A0AAV6Y3V3_9LAMI|nr:hypothetical protein BUALT_Bualt01G0022300 [Buddleja alternifolia]
MVEYADGDKEATEMFIFLKDQGVIGMIVIDDVERQVLSNYKNFPFATVTKEDGAAIRAYMNSTRNKNGVLHTYNKGFSGFAARLSEEEVKKIAQEQGVISVFPDPILKLHTTRSWDFLKHQIASGIDSSTPNSHANGTDTIIGILDTGIRPESESFNDADMGPIPSRWKGICMEGKDNFSCNRKIIGARYYDEYISGTSPRDEDGHGSHVASTAAGRPVNGASYYGLAKGTAVGGSPKSRIAIYRVCDPSGECPGSATLKAFDDAIADRVDVLSLSLGYDDTDFAYDPITIGAFHAVERGIIVVCSAGNSGPSSSTALNIAPWILTVAATTIDCDFEVDVVLGEGNKVIKGGGINFSDLEKYPVYPLVDGTSTRKSYFKNQTEDDAKVNEAILLVEYADGDKEATKMFVSLKDQGAIGMIVINDDERQVPINYKNFPFAAVTKDDGAEIRSYINSTSNPLATILPTVVIPNYKPAPVVAYFSSRGPPSGVKNLIKPDIAAPGVAILAAWRANDTNEALPGKDPPDFNIISGTSMSCPHVSGLAATVKSRHPTWSSSAVKSAIMTTAIQTNNLNAPITTETGSRATPYDIGAGEISLFGPLQPGLVYETETMEYIQFLCNLGYNTSIVKMIALDLPNNFSCPVNSNSDSISNMNYPSIAISNFNQNGLMKTVYRTVTNVGEEDESIYTAIVEAPAGVEVEVVPNKLEFTKDVKKLQFQVNFKVIAASDEDLFGSITWSNGKYEVRSPFVVSSV